VANYQNGGRSSASDEHRPSWRPQDQAASSNRGRGNEDDRDYSSWRERNQPVERDPRRWEGSRGSELGTADRDRSQTEYYGQGQSGYAAGRYGEDRAQQGAMQNRNEMWSPTHGESEARQREDGTDDRWSGRGASHWSDRRDRGGYDPERYGAQGGYGGGSGFEDEFGGRQGRFDRGYDQRGQGYTQGSSGAGNYDRGRGGYEAGGISGDRMARMNEMGPYDQRMGYQGGYDRNQQHMNYNGPAYVGPGQQHADWSPSQRNTNEETQRHTHRGTGPHRGKGPQGYQRSDERIRELVCEALADDDMIDASQIQVAVKDGEVTLTGTVDNRRIRREAEDCVSSVSGVRDVQVQLRVRDERQKQSQSTSGSNVGTSIASSNGSIGNSTTGKIETETAGGSSSQDKKHRA